MKDLIPSTISRRLTREQKQLVRSLEAEFGTSFTAWMADDQSQFVCVYGDGQGIDSEVRAMLPSVYASESPKTLTTASGEALLIVPLITSYCDPAVAITSSPEKSLELLARYAALFLEKARLERGNRQINEVNDSLTHAVAGCYEELIFLRDLAAQLSLEIGSASTICELLPRLCATLRVESLAMISDFYPDEGERHNDARSTSPEILWSEEAFLDDHRCLQLLGEFVGHSDAEVAIQNDFVGHPLAPEFPEIREFLLVRVGKPSAGRWLFAVNRILDERARKRRYRASEKELGTNEATLLTSAASFLSTHFQNLELLHQKEEMFLEIVRALVNALEARDPYTSGHSERVALYAKRLAEQIGLDDEACELVHLSGLLHDVGKLGVNDAILRKDGHLSDAEYLAISQHPEFGRAILRDLSHLRNVLPGVLYHHERYDGKGYPEKLAGDAIPLEGRLLAVCDAYDAMTSDRPYRNGMPEERAESIIREGAGVQWDPVLVDAFFEALPDILRIRDDYHQRTAASNPTQTDGVICVPVTSDAGGTVVSETPVP